VLNWLLVVSCLSILAKLRLIINYFLHLELPSSLCHLSIAEFLKLMIDKQLDRVFLHP